MCASLQPLWLEAKGARRQGECWELLWQGVMGVEKRRWAQGKQEINRKEDPPTECQPAILKPRPAPRAWRKKQSFTTFHSTRVGVNLLCAGTPCEQTDVLLLGAT